ncbi:MAG: hypothetical protein IJB48_03340, partial [Clostridia bacterium]|nr:hypothetical protein [Clostridia bacterium]
MMKHTVVITEPTKNLEISQEFGRFYSDGAICGNGDIGLILGGSSASELFLYITKTDFWNSAEGKVGNGGIRPIARLRIRLIQTSQPCEYRIEERLDDGALYAKMGTFEFTFTPCATDNTILVSMNYPKINMQPKITLEAIEGDGSETAAGKDGDVSWVTRSFCADGRLFETHAIVTNKRFPLHVDGMSVSQTIALGVTTNHDTAAYMSHAVKKHTSLREYDCARLLANHARFWQDFWSKSKVEMSDKELELNWYFGIYVMACCARNKKFPPGIFGTFITTDDVAWAGDYHLNYNLQSPFYPLASSNHVELMECYDEAYRPFIPEGRRFAKEFLNCRGVYFPVSLGPLGMNPAFTEHSPEFSQQFLGQKNNSVHLTTIIAMRWYSTLDLEYAKNVYPYMLEVADFWEDYLRFEDDRYFIDNDAVHELEYWREDYDPIRHGYWADDMNTTLTIGLLKMFFTCLLDMCKRLDNENKDNAKWKHILEHLSPYATYERDGKTVFRYTEKGKDWHTSGSLCLQHVYPANGVDLSDEAMHQLTLDTFRVANRWIDNNSYSSYYPCAARIGIDPDEIIEHMRYQFNELQFQSKMFYIFGGSLENTSATTNTLNEMMLQSFDGTVKVFPCFPKAMDCSFENLRAYGAFLVSSEQKDGKILGVTVVSEKGEELKLKNPYSAAKVTAD